MIPAFDAYLFDIDGTLLDSALDICGSVQQVLSTANADLRFSHEYLKGYIGLHLIDLFGPLFPHYSPEQIDVMIQDYRAIYLARGHSQTAVFPGVAEALAALPGRKATATTKGTPTTAAILRQFGLIQYFDHVQGTDGIPSKPAPDVLLAALNGLSAKPASCLMVGDSPADMEAGRRAGVQICAVRYGYGKSEDLAKMGAGLLGVGPARIAAVYLTLTVGGQLVPELVACAVKSLVARLTWQRNVGRTVLPSARVSEKAPVGLADGKTVRPTSMLDISQLLMEWSLHANELTETA